MKVHPCFAHLDQINERLTNVGATNQVVLRTGDVLAILESIHAIGSALAELKADLVAKFIIDAPDPDEDGEQ